jgi:hypothetical protein
MNDQDLARALRVAVNVDHSPEFLARVRARVSMERAPIWSRRWVFGPVAAALAAIAVIGLIDGWRTGQRSVSTPTPVTISKGNTAAPVPVPSTMQAPSVIASASPPKVMRMRPARNIGTRPAAASRLPEALIARDDARAFEMLLTKARELRIPGELPTEGVSASREVALPRIEIPPVIIEPLPEIARLEGDRP